MRHVQMHLAREQASPKILPLLTLVTVIVACPPAAAQEGVQCPAEPTDMPVQFGDAVRCSLEIAGDSDVFRLTAAAGDTIVLRASRAIGSVTPCVQIVGPAVNQQACLASPSNRVNVALTSAGVFTISIRDFFTSGTGVYTLAIERVRPPANATVMIYGQTIADTISVAGDSDLVVFAGTAGDLVRASASRVVGAVTPCLELWAPMAFVTATPPEPDVVGCIASPSNQIELTLPQTGTYALMIHDFFTVSTGTYSVTIQCLTGSCIAQPSPPTALNDTFSALFETPLVVPPPGVLANDNSNGGGTMTVVLDTTVSNGVLTLNADGGFTYTPMAGFSGADSFTYRAVNTAGAGNAATVTITVASSTAPLAPTGLYAASVVGHLVTLRWQTATTGPSPTHFVVEGGLTPGSVQASLSTGTAFPIFTFSAPTGSFYVRVHAVSGSLRSAASNEIRIHVNVPVAPSAPSGFVGLVNGSSVALAWRNTFSGGPPASIILDVSGPLVGSFPIGLAESVAFAGVPPGTYTISLRAANGGGGSASSNALTLTFPGLCSGAPLMPENFLAYRVGSTLVVLWEPASSGPAPTGFEVNVNGAFSAVLTTASRTLSGIVAPGSYTFSVRATNACGASATTPPQTVVVS